MNIDKVINIPRNERLVFEKTDSNSTYGELTKQGAIQLVNQLKTRSPKSFCDLGSGIGIVLKYMIDMVPSLNIIDGVELSEERYKNSLYVINKARRNQKVNLWNDDIMNIDISNYDMIYISNLCFNHDYNQKLSKKLDNEIKNNAIVFASQNIYFKRHVIKSCFPINQSWGKNTQMFKYEIIE